MHIAPDKYKAEDADSDFDFLKPDEPDSDPSSGSREKSAQSSGARSRRPAKAQSADRPFPKIRKPVPVTESGAIRAPKAGDPVAPPPALTDGIKLTSNVSSPKHSQAQRDPIDFEKIDLGLDDDDWPNSDQWTNRAERPMPELIEDERQSPLRKFGYSLGVVLIIAGVGSALYRVPVVQQWFGSVYPANLPSSTVNLLPEPVPSEPLAIALVTNTPFQRYQVELKALESMLARQELDAASLRLQNMDRTLYGYGKTEFDLIAERIAKGPASPEELAAQAAEQATLEQATLEQAAADQVAAERIAAEQAALEQQAAADQAAAEQAALEQQAAADQAAAEQAALEQQAAADQAAAEQAALEQQAATERAAAEQAALEQQAAAERAAAEQAALEQQAAAERAIADQTALDKQLAASVEQRRLDRVSQERARDEQLEIALRERFEQEQRLQKSAQQSAQQAAAAKAYKPRELRTVAPTGESQTIQALPEPSQTVRDIAAAQRAAAREQRLAEARERNQSSINEPSPAATVTPADNIVARVEILDAPVLERAATPRSISDDELQRVYRSFTQLVDSIESRDINAMINLTELSGLRVQQFLQLFENNVSIEAKLRNVSTLDASGEIQGILQVTRLVRADGSVTGPPFNLSSVQLSAVREGNGWSAIRW